MSLAPGVRLGSYEIAALLGAGGMGEVYRGRDIRLHRDVAIKVLPDIFAADDDRVARLEREAQTLAALNHPNLAQVFGLLEVPRQPDSPGGLALVMELVDGEDLAARLSRGRLPIDEALAIARQIAAGLDAAHERDIIHRDLKPANIKISSDGQAKILDFGLAKSIAPAAGAISPDTPTLTSPAVTQMGVMLGTAPYMSPEQAKGRAADRRSDIWAFGCVLYEMLAGKPVFPGGSIGEVIAAVLTADIDWGALPPETPASVQRLLRRCLERDPKRRLRDIGDAALELESDLAIADRHLTRSSAPRWMYAGAIAAVVASAGAVGWLWTRPRAAPPVRAAVIPDAGYLDFSTIAISPDGSQLAHYRDRADRGGDLLVRRLDGFSERILVEQVVAVHPFFSPTGTDLAFSSNDHRAVLRVPLAGGPPREVVRVADAYPGLWLEDGSIVVSTAHVDGRVERGLTRVPPGGGKPERLTTLAGGEELHFAPSPLPGGRILFTVLGGGAVQLAVTDAAAPGGHRVLPFLPATTPRYLPSGHLLYFESTRQAVIAVPFDLRRAEPTGTPVPVVTNVRGGLQGIGSYDVSREGHLFYTSQSEGEFAGHSRLSWADTKDEVITDERAPWAQPRLAPDGRRLLARHVGPTCVLWLYDLDRGSRIRVLARDAHDAVWHTDGRRLIFSDLDAAGLRRTFVARVGSTDAPVLLETGYEGSEVPRSVSPDGAWIAVTRPTATTGRDLWIVPAKGGNGRPLVASNYAEDFAAFSPDGNWIAYTSNQSGRDEVYVRPWPAADQEYQVSTGGGTGAVWSGDSRRIIYADGRRIVAVDVTSAPGTSQFTVAPPQPLIHGRVPLQRVGNYDLARDGRLVIVEASDARVDHDLRIVFNWIEELRRKMSAQ
jgi:serine/threonine-protein kinase